MNLPFKIDLNNKTAVVTGAGGVLCSSFAEALAQCGAKVAVLDLRLEAAQAVADKIRAEGGTANAYACNVLDKESLEKVREEVCKDFGPCNILINGSQGNRICFQPQFPRNAFAYPGVCQGYGDGKGSGDTKCFVNECFQTAYQDSGILWCQSCGFQSYGMACCAFCQNRNTLQRHSSRIFRNKAE